MRCRAGRPLPDRLCWCLPPAAHAFVSRKACGWSFPGSSTVPSDCFSVICKCPGWDFFFGHWYFVVGEHSGWSKELLSLSVWCPCLALATCPGSVAGQRRLSSRRLVCFSFFFPLQPILFRFCERFVTSLAEEGGQCRVGSDD